MLKYLLVALGFVLLPLTVHAEQSDTPPTDTFYKARVLTVLSERTEETLEGAMPVQEISLRILNGEEKGETITIEHGSLFSITDKQKVSQGDTVIITKTGTAENDYIYYITDKYRIPGLIYSGIIFLAIALFFGRKKGFTSLVGLAFTCFVIFYWMLPRILQGGSPLPTTVIGIVVIACVSLYLSHGFTKRTSLALASTLLALACAFIFDLLFVHLTGLTGAGSEESFYLQFTTTTIDLRGLLLAGILLGVLGILDDITTAQTATIAELHQVNPNLSRRELYTHGLSIGREHIASLINTLILAYVGVSLPFILLFAINKTTPLWVTLNSSFIAEEIVRALVGSVTLVIAVPLTTILAAYWYTKKMCYDGRN